MWGDGRLSRPRSPYAAKAREMAKRPDPGHRSGPGYGAMAVQPDLGHSVWPNSEAMGGKADLGHPVWPKPRAMAIQLDLGRRACRTGHGAGMVRAPPRRPVRIRPAGTRALFRLYVRIGPCERMALCGGLPPEGKSRTYSDASR